QFLFGFRGLLVEKLDLPRGPLEIHVPPHIEGRKRCEDTGGTFRIGILVVDLDKVRLFQGFDIQTAGQPANGMFDFGWALGVRCVRWNEFRHYYNLLQEFFIRNIGTGEIHGAGGLGRDDGVKAAPAQQNLEMRFISRGEDREEHRCQQYEPKRSSHESRTPEQRGRKFAGCWGKSGARASVEFRGHGSYSKADYTRRALWELARFLRRNQ